MRSSMPCLPGAARAPAPAMVVLVVAMLLASASMVADGAPIDSFHNKSCNAAGCHNVRHDEPGVISHPSYLEFWCDRCHVDHSSNTPMLLAAEPNQLCLQCHTDTDVDDHGVLHPPGAGSCTECHSPHQSTFRHLLREEEMLLQCSACHAEDLEAAAAKPFHHRFFDPGAECASCHYAHRAGEGGYLRGNLGETCLTCHDMNIRSRGRSLENVGFEIRRAPHIHEPLREHLCQACHTPHGSVQPSLLHEGYPVGNYARYDHENYSLCWSCHDSQLVESPLTRTATKFRDGDQNLHSIHVLQTDRGRACHLCHTAHASDRPFLLRETILFREWDSDFHFEVRADGGSCATACHRPTEYSRSTP